MPLVRCEQNHCPDRAMCYRYVMVSQPKQKVTLFGAPATIGKTRCKFFVDIPMGASTVDCATQDVKNEEAFRGID